MRSVLPTLLGLGLLAGAAAAQTTVQLGADLDNTIFEPIGSQSNGSGDHIFAGNTNSGFARRALLRFDVATIPPGSVIESVDLRLVMTMTVAGPRAVSMHRALQTWGAAGSDAPGMEGGGTLAQPGDATWTDRFFGSQAWTNPGGDFVPAPSASRNVAGNGAYVWSSTPELVADVQGWVDGSSENTGWILIGNENSTPSAKRFDSSENPNPNTRPRLTVTYLPNPCGTSAIATETVRLGTPANPDALLPGASGPPRIGQTWEPRVDHSSFQPAALVDVLLIGRTAVNLPASFGTLLVDLTPPILTLTNAPGAPFSIAVPNDCVLVGLQRFAQAASADAAGTIEVTNALDLVLGNL